MQIVKYIKSAVGNYVIYKDKGHAHIDGFSDSWLLRCWLGQFHPTIGDLLLGIVSWLEENGYPGTVRSKLL